MAQDSVFGHLLPGQAAPAAPRPVATPRDVVIQEADAYKPGEVARDEVRTGIAVDNNERAGREEARGADNDRFNQGVKLTSEFEGLKEVQTYKAAMPVFTSGLKSSPDAGGDMMLVNAYAKVMDPTSAVMQGEQDNVAAAASPVQRQILEWQRNFNIGNGGTFPEHIRAQLRKAMLGRVKELNRGYNSSRHAYENRARAYGLDPEIVLGQHFGRDFLKEIEGGIEANRGGIQEDGQGTGEDEQGGLTGSVTDEGPGSYGPNDPYSLDNIALAAGQGLGSMVAGVGDLAGIVVNPINTAIGRAAGYDGYTSDFGGTVRDTLGLPQNPNATTDAIIRGGTGALSGSLAARGASALANPGPWQNALATFGANPLSDAAAGGAAAGSSQAAQDMGLGMPGQIAAGLIGGVGGYGAGRGVGRGVAAADGLSAARAPNALLQAADRQKTTLMPADAGGTGTRMATGVVGRTLGEIPIAEGAQASLKTASNANSRVAANVGAVTDPTGAGQAAQRGAKSFVATSGRRGGDLFENIGIQNDAEAVADNTRQAITEVTKGFTSNPKLSKIWTGNKRLRDTLEALTPVDNSAAGRQELAAANEALTGLRGQYEALQNTVVDPKRLVALREEIATAEDAVVTASAKASAPPQGGKVSWEDMKRLRTIVGEIVGKPGLSSDGAADSAMRKFYGALTADMEVTAKANGPRALTEFRRANQYWRGRQDRIDNVLSGILGNDLNKGETAAFEQINRWAQTKGGDFKKLGQALRSMPAEEADTVRATLIERMGRASPGRQNEDGLEFSPAEWVTQWNKIDGRAKSALFPDAKHRADLNDLALIFSNMKRAGDYANVSKTSLGTNAVAHVAALAGGPIGIITSIAAAGAELSLGKLLASPRFARWLASVPAKPSQGAQRHFMQGLGTIATREPVIANDIAALQQHLQQTFSGSPLRAAAGEEEQDGRRKPPAK